MKMMNRNKMIKPLFLVFAIGIIFTACKKEDDFEGPSLVDLYGDFAVIEGLEVSNSNVDFEGGQTTFFTARISKNVNWTLKITGVESGAVKYITGFSNELNSTNARWNGTTTDLPMFRAEACMAELSFENETEVLTANLSVASAKLYQGLVLADFESGFPTGWTTFIQSGAGMSFTVTNTDIAGQGNFYYDMGGAVDWDYLIGYIDIPGSAYNTEGTSFPLSNNPANNYFNTLLYNPPGVNNAIVLFQFWEDDNQNGTYENNEDMWSLQVDDLTTGWQRISRKYSDIPALVNGQPSTPAGNGVHEPNKLRNIRLLFLANPATGYSQNYLDYMIFTENGALQP